MAWAPLCVAMLLTLTALLFLHARACRADDGSSQPSEEDISRLEEKLASQDLKVEGGMKVHDPDAEDDYRLIVTTSQDSSLPDEPRVAVAVFVYSYVPGRGFTGGGERIFFQDRALKTQSSGAVASEMIAEADGQIGIWMRENGLVEGWPEKAPPEESVEEDKIRPSEPEGESAGLAPVIDTGQPPGGVRGVRDVPGPASWPQAATGILLPGFLGLAIALLTRMLGGGFAPPGLPLTGLPGPGATPSSTLDDMLSAPLEPPAATGAALTTGLQPSLGEGARFGLDAYRRWAADHPYLDGVFRTLNDTFVSAMEGTHDFAAGAATAFYTGYKELGMLGYDLFRGDPLGTLKEMFSGEVLSGWMGGVWAEVRQSIDPTEEIKAILDPQMPLEVTLWAGANVALKAANVLLMKKGAEDFVDHLTRPPGKPVVPRSQPLETAGMPAAGKPEMSVDAANEVAKKLVPGEHVVQYRTFKSDAQGAVDRFTSKVEGGGQVTREDVTRVMQERTTKRTLLKEAPQGARKAFQEGQRKIYDAVDDKVKAGLRENPAYGPDAEFVAEEVSTGGKADAAGSTDRDVIYYQVKKVKVMEGGKEIEKVVREPVPAKDVKPAYDKAFAEETGFDPARPARGCSAEEWQSMSLEERQAAHAEQYGQTCMERTHQEFIAEYRVDKGPGVISEDPEMMGMVYQRKFMEKWVSGDVSLEADALEQLRKMGEAAKRSGAVFDDKMNAAMDIVSDTSRSPMEREIALRYIGIRNGAAGMAEKLRSMIQSK